MTRDRSLIVFDDDNCLGLKSVNSTIRGVTQRRRQTRQLETNQLKTVGKVENPS